MLKLVINACLPEVLTQAGLRFKMKLFLRCIAIAMGRKKADTDSYRYWVLMICK
jgi:hypothetical protein